MELKNCPFCGGNAKIYLVTENERYARCTECGVRQLPYYKIPENQIIADWNTRVEPELTSSEIYTILQMINGALIQGGMGVIDARQAIQIYDKLYKRVKEESQCI